ncbi:DUF3298 and DUF4163 domain-containing protein [Bacillus horti]|uniref:DUF3298 domain-containing protein n=1 Tax=Caldalkalibacillus horti TaxID=77523 RepID=A0ABT9VXI3_9BACI|nr:DUF3298 and DUF4163 domain-containing protein [Bacillus horti]MDQ0165330.1 hypothetical protein [Bacillus horti]
MKKRKLWSSLAITAGIVLSSATLSHVAASDYTTNQVTAPEVVLSWEGEDLQRPALLIYGNTMIPLATLRDELGIEVKYDSERNTYVVGSEPNRINIVSENLGTSLTVNQVNTNIYQAINRDGHLYVPFSLLRDYMSFDGVWNGTQKTLDLTTSEQNEIDFERSFVERSEGDSTISLEYPVLSGNAAGIEQINEAIEAHVTSYTDYAEEALQSYVEGERPYQFIGTFNVTYNKNGVVNILMQENAFTGAAHGLNTRESLTFVLETGERIQLEDLLLDGNPNYVTELNHIVSEELPNMNGYIGGFEGLDADPRFFLRNEGIVLFFDQYEYTSYAAGFPEIYVPFHSILPEGIDPFKGFPSN